MKQIKVKLIKFFRRLLFLNKPPEKIFQLIYRKNLWKSKESASGPGSELAHTQLLREHINHLLTRYPIKSIVDAGCGDFNWAKEILFDNVHYTGIDIVEEIIKSNIFKYSQPNITFLHANLITDPLPKADLIMCRDVLVHLNYDQIIKVLNNLYQSQSKYLLITSFSGIGNKNIFTGDWRPVNLQEAPFHLPQPLHIIEESISGKIQKQFCLWDRDRLSKHPLFS